MTHPTDDLAAFSIGAIEPDEAAKVASHLRGCETCRAEVAAYEETAWRLAEAVGKDPPARMREAVVERARAEPRARPSVLAPILDLLRRPVPAFVPAALAVVLVLAFVGYAGARRDVDRYATALAGVQNARITALAPGADRPQVRGALVQPTTGTPPYLLLDLGTAPPGKTWQAWVIRGEQPLPAGISGDVAVIILTVPLEPGDVVAVTLENAGGSSKPTSTPVLTGKSS